MRVFAPSFLVALTLLLSASGCGERAGTAAADRGLAMHECAIARVNAHCGTLAVAENPNDPAARHINLNVAVVPAQTDRRKRDPLFWFSGWGGAGVSDDAANVLPMLRSVNTYRDVVFIDQRGTGSSRLTCDVPSSPHPTAALLARITRAARGCADRIGPNFKYYTSAVAVDDFDRVREALGYDTINIYGGSYGVTTGLVYLLRHETHVRSAVFDSGSLLDVHIFERQPANGKRALAALFARCAADDTCHRAFPNVAREYRRLVIRLARHPLSVPGATVKIDGAVFASAIGGVIAYTPGKAIAPRMIHLIATGQIARAAKDFPHEQTRQLAYQLLIQCSEPWASWRPDVIKRLGRGTDLLPSALATATEMRAVCAGIPKAPVPSAIGKRVRSRVPILFLTGAEDAADPPANIAHATRELPNSRTVIFAGAGHGQLALYCAQTLIGEFVAGGSARYLDPWCADSAALIPFDTRK